MQQHSRDHERENRHCIFFTSLDDVLLQCNGFYAFCSECHAAADAFLMRSLNNLLIQSYTQFRNNLLVESYAELE